jgi:hypothetical protein
MVALLTFIYHFNYTFTYNYTPYLCLSTRTASKLIGTRRCKENTLENQGGCVGVWNFGAYGFGRLLSED